MIHVLILVVLSFLLSINFSFSMPQDSLKEKKRCSVCHIGTGAGGPRTAAGNYYAKFRTLVGFTGEVDISVKFAKAKTKPKRKIPTKTVEKEEPGVSQKTLEELKAELKSFNKDQVEQLKRYMDNRLQDESTHLTKKVKSLREEVNAALDEEPVESILDKTQYGGDFKLWFLRDTQVGLEKNFFLIQAEPTFTSTINDDLNFVFGYNFAPHINSRLEGGQLTAYTIYDLPKDFYFKLGAYHLPIGLNFIDDTTLIKSIYAFQDLQYYKRNVAFQFGFDGIIFFNAGITNGINETSYDTNDNFGYYGNVGIHSTTGIVPILLGTTFYFENTKVKLKENDDPNTKNVFEYDSVNRDTWISDTYLEVAVKNFDLAMEVIAASSIRAADLNTLGAFGRLNYDFSKFVSTAFKYSVFYSDWNKIDDQINQLGISLRYKFTTNASLEFIYNLDQSYGQGNYFFETKLPEQQYRFIDNDKFILLFHTWF